MLFQVAVVKNKKKLLYMKGRRLWMHFLDSSLNNCIVNDKKGGRFSPVHLLFQFTSEKL